MKKILIAALVGFAPCAPVFAAQGHAPGTVKTESQIKSDLDRSTSALCIAAGQATSAVETGTGQIVVRRREERRNSASDQQDVLEIHNTVSGSGTRRTGGAVGSA